MTTFVEFGGHGESLNCGKHHMADLHRFSRVLHPSTFSGIKLSAKFLANGSINTAGGRERVKGG